MATGTARYKGKTYKLLFAGQTRFGRRAHLQFWNGRKTFWVDESKLENVCVRDEAARPVAAAAGRVDELDAPPVAHVTESTVYTVEEAAPIMDAIETATEAREAAELGRCWDCNAVGAVGRNCRHCEFGQYI